MEILSKNRAKFIASLGQKKHRDINGLFIAEGEKLIEMLLPHFELDSIIATERWYASSTLKIDSKRTVVAENEAQMKQISQLVTPPSVLAIFVMRKGDEVEIDSDKLYLALDRVQDPGNLGTIIRLADWFGIDTILASHTTAEIYNPKVIQATMGAIGRVNVIYCDLESRLAKLAERGVDIYGTFLEGENIYRAQLGRSGVVVMGNEGSGISKEIEATISHKIFIPPYRKEQLSSESLNVASATAITLSQFRQ